MSNDFLKTATRKAARLPLTYGYSWRFVHYLARVAITYLLALPAAQSFAQERRIRIVALGDSLTAGYMLSARAAFPAVLERALSAAGRNVEVVNAGVSGDTASNGLERLEWAIADGADGLVLELGANDMLRGLNPEVTYKALTEIVSRTKMKGVRVLLSGMRAAPGLGRVYEDSFNSIFPRIAREQGVPLYPFFLEGVVGNPALQLADGLHPSNVGVELIVKNILPMVLDMVASIHGHP